MKFYKIIITLFLFHYFLELTVAQTPVIQWQKSYGGTEDDIAYSICILSNHGYAVVGASESSNGNVSNHYPSTPGFLHNDVWFLKLDSSGIVRKSKCFGGTDEDKGNSIIQTMDGGFIIAGLTNSKDGDVIGSHDFWPDFWVVKTDSNGILQWQKCIGGYESDGAEQIIQCKDSGYLVIGETGGRIPDILGFHGSTDMLVIKLNQNGTKQWAKCFGGPSAEDTHSCVQTNDGGFILAGEASNDGGDVSGFHNAIYSDIWVVKIDSIGTIQWQRCYGGTSSDFYPKVMVSNTNDVFILGSTNSRDGDVTNFIGNFDLWLLKIDSASNILWQKCFGGINYENAFSACPTSDGGIAMIGASYFDDGIVTGTHGMEDFWVCKVDSSGNFLWGKSLGGSQDDEASSIQETPDGGLILAGSTSSIDGDVTSNHGGKDYWIVKLAPLGLTVPELENSFMELNIFQSNNQLNLRYFSKHNQNAQLFLYDINGKNVFEKSISVNEGINYNTISSTGLAAGMYFVRMDGEKGWQSGKIVIQ